MLMSSRLAHAVMYILAKSKTSVYFGVSDSVCPSGVTRPHYISITASKNHEVWQTLFNRILFVVWKMVSIYI